jgi:hypothetical protein
MPSLGFEPAIPAIERPLTYALDRLATQMGKGPSCVPKKYEQFVLFNVN